MLEFRVLGPVRVTRGGEALDIGGPRQKAVLAVLVAHAGEVVSVDRLVEYVWGDSASDGSKRSLQTYMSNLRRVLDPDRTGLIASSGDGYLLNPDGALVDWQVLESSSDAAAVRGALKLWADPLSDVEGAWAEPLRTAWTERWLGLVERAAELALGSDPAAAVPDLEAAIGSHPLRESLWALLMQAQAAAGRPAEALKTYKRLEKLLGEEMGVEPSPELRGLEEKILLEDESTARVVRTRGSGLPADRTRLVGRGDDLDRVVQLLRAHRLVTLLGPGGSGKTRLAIAAAREMEGEGVEAVLVDLSPMTEATDVVLGVAADLNVVLGTGSGARAPLDQLAQAVRSREVLIILDNCEHVIDTAAEVADALIEGPGVRMVTTSREALEIPGEYRYSVPPLSLQSNAGISDALDLLLELSPQLSPDDQEMETLDGICRSLDGMPLAIELVSAQLSFLSPAELAAGLDRRLAMSGGGRRRSGRHRSLHATIEWSWTLLSADEQRLLAELSVFTGGWTLEAAQCVCTGSDSLVLQTLANLVAKSLVQVEPGLWGTRYRLLETVRIFALERLGDPGSVRKRHSVWFAEWVDSWSVEEHWVSGEVASRLEDDRGNLRAALTELVATGNHDDAVRIVSSRMGLWLLHVQGEEAFEWTGMIDPGELSNQMRVRWLIARGQAFQANGDYATMWEFADEAALEAGRLDLPALQGVAMASGSFGHLLTDLFANESRWTALIDVARRSSSPRLEGTAWAMLGNGAYLSGRPTEECWGFVERGRSLVGPDGWDHSIFQAAEQMLMFHDGRFAEALALARERVNVSERLDLALDVARCKGLLAYAAARAGERAVWREALLEAREFFLKAWGSKADIDLLQRVAAWEIFQGDPLLGSELFSTVRQAGLHYPESYVEYSVLSRQLRDLDLPIGEVAAARERGASTPAAEVVAREFTRIGIA